MQFYFWMWRNKIIYNLIWLVIIQTVYAYLWCYHMLCSNCVMCSICGVFYFYNSLTISFMARAITCYHGDRVICVRISGNKDYDSKVLLECSYFIFSKAWQIDVCEFLFGRKILVWAAYFYITALSLACSCSIVTWAAPQNSAGAHFLLITKWPLSSTQAVYHVTNTCLIYPLIGCSKSRDRISKAKA